MGFVPLTFVGNFPPVLIREGELAGLDLVFHGLFVIEREDSTQTVRAEKKKKGLIAGVQNEE